MTEGTTEEAHGTTAQQILALLIVGLMASIGGMAVKSLSGFKFGKFVCKPSLKIITIPPLVGMIILGCLTRNFIGSTMDSYPEALAGWVRIICLSVILLRGGLELDFEGKGILVVLLTLCP